MDVFGSPPATPRSPPPTLQRSQSDLKSDTQTSFMNNADVHSGMSVVDAGIAGVVDDRSIGGGCWCLWAAKPHEAVMIIMSCRNARIVMMYFIM